METQLQRPQTLFAHPVRYEVPNFQRRYVWNQDEQWEPLWDDVADLAESVLEGNCPEHTSWVRWYFSNSSSLPGRYSGE